MFGTKCYEQAVGFSAMEADELVYVNGGSGSSGCYMGQYSGTPSYAQDMSTTVISYTVPAPDRKPIVSPLIKAEGTTIYTGVIVRW